MKTLYYVLFQAHPSTEPPFEIVLGTADEHFKIRDCQHIPDSIERLKSFCVSNQIELTPELTLLYPIYLDAMDTEYESTMHHIAWLVKEQADKNGWKFDRTGGYTGNTVASFLPKRE